MTSKMKTCCRCKQTKDVDQFSLDKHRKDGRRNTCKVCQSQSYQSYYNRLDREGSQNMSEIILLDQLAEQLKISADSVVTYCKAAGLKHSTLNIAGKPLMAFDKALAVSAVEDAIKKARQAAEAEAAKSAPKPEKPASQQILEALNDVHALLEALQKDVDALKMQGSPLLKAIETLRSETNSGIGKLAHSIEQIAAPKQEEKEQPPKQPEPEKLKVVVAGIHASDQELIKREFAELLDLYCFSPIDAEGQRFDNLLRKADAVYMNSNHLTREVRRNVMDLFPEVETFKGISILKEMLTNVALA